MPASVPFLDGAEIDYATQATGGQLQIRAPKIKGEAPAESASLVERVRWIVEHEINPQLAQHRGHVAVQEVTADGVVVLRFGGGCHGCGMADVTLKQGIEKTLLTQGAGRDRGARRDRPRQRLRAVHRRATRGLSRPPARAAPAMTFLRRTDRGAAPAHAQFVAAGTAAGRIPAGLASLVRLDAGARRRGDRRHRRSDRRDLPRARTRAAAARALALNRWQAFTTLWRQQWQPASEDERGVRIVASVVTLLVHLFLAIFLLYLAYVRFMAIPEPRHRRRGRDPGRIHRRRHAGRAGRRSAAGRRRRRTPRLPPRRAQQTPAQADQQSRNRRRRRRRHPGHGEPPAPPPPSPAPPVEQPLQVTETPVPDQVFTVPPVRVTDVPQPQSAGAAT